MCPCGYRAHVSLDGAFRVAMIAEDVYNVRQFLFQCVFGTNVPGSVGQTPDQILLLIDQNKTIEVGLFNVSCLLPAHTLLKRPICASC